MISNASAVASIQSIPNTLDYNNITFIGKGDESKEEKVMAVEQVVELGYNLFRLLKGE